MSQFYSRQVSLAGPLGVLLLCLATAQAQTGAFPATQESCNIVLKYVCFGGIYCCPYPASCIPNPSSDSVPFICEPAGGFPVNGGSGGVPGGEIVPPTPVIPGGPGPVVGPTLPPVFPGGNSVPLPGGESSTPSPLPSDSLTTSITLPSTSTSHSSTPTPPLPLPPDSFTTSITLPLTSASHSSTPTPTLPGSGGGFAGGSNSGLVTPVSSSPTVPIPILPSPQGNSGNGSGRSGSGPASNSTSNTGKGTPGSVTPSNGTTGNGNGTIEFRGAVAPSSVTGSNLWGGLVIAVGIQLWWGN